MLIEIIQTAINQAPGQFAMEDKLLEDEVDITEVISTLFGTIDTTSENLKSNKYPEAVLQVTDKANKFYNSFQRYTRQFIDTDSEGIVRWNDSRIEATERKIVESWLGTDVNKLETTLEKKNKKTVVSKANKLFKWSSGDAYIAARKRELELKKGGLNLTSNGRVELKEEQDSSKNVEHIVRASTPKIQIPVESVANNLNRAIEFESNSFIHARIQKIKAHHSEAIKKQIHERKKVDHELHLKRLRLKEEEYEREMELSLAAQQKQPGFLGSLFGFGSSSTGQQNITQHPNSSNLSVDSSSQPGSSSTQKSKIFSFLTFGKQPASDFSKLNTPSTDVVDKTIDSGAKLDPVDDTTDSSHSKDEIGTSNRSQEIAITNIIKNDNSNETKELKEDEVTGDGDVDDDDDDDDFANFESSIPTTGLPTKSSFGSSSFIESSNSPKQHQSLSNEPSDMAHQFLSIDNHRQSSNATPPNSSQNMAALMDIFGTPTSTQHSNKNLNHSNSIDLLDI